MSTNIASIKVLGSSGDFHLPPEAQINPAQCPERWDGEHITSWSGEGSGYSFFEYFVPQVLPLFKGWADLIVVWETGDLEGLRVRNGKVKRCAVVIKLEDI